MKLKLPIKILKIKFYKLIKNKLLPYPKIIL